MRSEHKADLITGLVLLALAAAVMVGGLTMDRLEIRQIHPASIPGLVPVILGAALAVAALALVLRAARRLRAQAPAGADETEAFDGGASRSGLAIALFLTIGYAVGLVGRIPYEIATGVFVFLFIAVFEWRPAMPARARLIRLGTALLQAVLVALVVGLVFDKLFLVRLP